MNIITNSNYQTSFGMRKDLKYFEIIQRKAKCVYPHVSPYNMSGLKSCDYGVNNKFYNYILNLQKKLEFFRYNLLSESRSFHKDLIENLKNGLKLGNSYEEATLASVIAKINGIKNIYTASIDGLDHAVCVITRKTVKEGKTQVLNNKEAIIIDPQLGITDYANNYFVRLKETIGNNNFRPAKLSVTPFKKQLKDEIVIQYLRDKYPELIINGNKEINDRKYAFKVGKKLIDADTYVNNVDRAIFSQAIKSIANFVGVVKTCNFAKVQYDMFKLKTEQELYAKIIKRCVDDLDNAIAKMEPEETIDKLTSILETFVRKYGYLENKEVLKRISKQDAEVMIDKQASALETYVKQSL